MFNKTPGELVAEISMERAADFKGVLLIVEALEDKKFWQGFAEPRSCRILQSYAKSCAIKAILLLVDLRRDSGVLAVVDDDFDMLLARRVNHNRVIYVDAHDLESLLIRSPAFDRAVAEYADADALRNLLATIDTTVREWILSRALRLGALRFRAQQNEWPVSLEKLSPYKVFDPKTHELNRAALMQFIKEQHGEFEENEIDKALAEIPAGDAWYIVHGHDLVALACMLLCNRLGVKHLGPKSLCVAIRVAFTWGDFERTEMHSQVCAWEQGNGLRLLKQQL